MILLQNNMHLLRGSLQVHIESFYKVLEGCLPTGWPLNKVLPVPPHFGVAEATFHVHDVFLLAKDQLLKIENLKTEHEVIW